MILYFLRHGKAGSPRPKNDEARELTKSGMAALRAGAPLWQRLRAHPNVVLSSPLVRALQTAQLFCEGTGAGEPVTDERLAPGAKWEDLALAMAEHPGGQSVIFVGHEPDLSAAIELLTGATSVRMRNGGLACIEFPDAPEPGAGEIAWLLDPDLYVAEDGD